jgi:hypothetical protein
LQPKLVVTAVRIEQVEAARFEIQAHAHQDHGGESYYYTQAQRGPWPTHNQNGDSPHRSTEPGSFLMSGRGFRHAASEALKS